MSFKPSVPHSKKDRRLGEQGWEKDEKAKDVMIWYDA
jgi:hypothetical protein